MGLKIGDKVISKYYGEGVVKKEHFNDFFAIEFKKAFGKGHTCSGVCKRGHGRYCKVLPRSEAYKCYRYSKEFRLPKLGAYVDEIVYLYEGEVIEWD